MPRVIYLMRFFFEHNNMLNPIKLNLHDYFTEDPNFERITGTSRVQTPESDLVLEFLVPNNLFEPYEDLFVNQKHMIKFNQVSDYQVVCIF